MKLALTAILLAALLAVPGLSGCAGKKVAPDEIPQQPIALTWWDSEDGRRRLEMQNDEGARKTPYLLREGVAELGRVQDLLDRRPQGSVDQRFPGRLVLLDPRTGEVTRVEQAPSGSRPLGWSPDHTRLLFSTDKLSGKHQIYDVHIETAEVRKLTRGPAHHIAAAAGPNRDLVYQSLARGRSGDLRARVMLSKGGRRATTLASDTIVRHLAFAPDGSSIAFVRLNDREGNGTRAVAPRVRVIPTDPDAEELEIGAGEHPVYTPDSQWIVYSSPAKDGSRLRRVRPDGSGRTSVGKAVRTETMPAVSPDGRFVIYVSEYNGLDRLFIKRFDGTGDRLFYDGGVVKGPVW